MPQEGGYDIEGGHSRHKEKMERLPLSLRDSSGRIHRERMVGEEDGKTWVLTFPGEVGRVVHWEETDEVVPPKCNGLCLAFWNLP